MLQILKHTLFPNLCASCRTFTTLKASPLCPDCRATITSFNTLVCGHCRARLADNKKICHSGSYALGIASRYHDQALQKTIQAIKFNYFAEAITFLSSLLISFTENLNPSPHILKLKPTVTHIPLSKKRLAERGFDQSQEIAKHFAAHFNLPHKTILTKTKDRPPQSLLKNKKERQENIRDAFEVKEPANSLTPLILIDDITTTGSTIDEAITTLRSAGYGPILALTVAG